jgi:hypothetical protein
VKFLFLGARYEKDIINVEVEEGETGGLYRGSPWKAHIYKQQLRRRNRSVELTYRGTPYKH